MKAYADHLRNTWYKNKLNLRNAQTFTAGAADILRNKLQLRWVRETGTHQWSIPGALDANTVVYAGWDHTITCIDTLANRILWTFRTQGPVYSSPAVRADGSFVIGGEDGCLRYLSAQGELLWSIQGGGKFHGTPTIDEARGRVFSGNFDHKMYAVDLQTGQICWTYQSGEIFDDIYSSPALTRDGGVVFGTGSDLVALNAQGQVMWVLQKEATIDPTPALHYDFGIGAVGSDEGCVYGFGIADGHEHWKVDVGDKVFCSAAIGLDGMLCVGSENGMLWGIEMDTGRVAWQQPTRGAMRYTALTTLPDGAFLLTSNRESLICVEADNGLIRWEVEGPHGFHTAPLVTPDGQVVVGSDRGAVYFYDGGGLDAVR